MRHKLLINKFKKFTSPGKRKKALSYQKWIDLFESENVNSIDNQISALSYLPKISILVPVYNPDLSHFRACVNSVLGQSYTNWELCLVDDNSSQKFVKPIIHEFSSKENRIKYTFRNENGHVGIASNSALDLATGDYIALLDQDDLLSKNALLELVKAINSHPESQLLYSDEDKIDAQGRRFEPHFKSNWNPDLLLSQNYISHLTVYKADLIRQVGGFHVGLEGAQDHDLLLRCSSLLNVENIVHIPRILYHWRATVGSTALDPKEKNYTTEAGVNAVQSLHDGRQTGGKVERGALPNTYKSLWPLPEDKPLVSIIIPTRNSFRILKKCIKTLLSKTTYPNYEILIVNNQSKCKRTLKFMKYQSQYHHNIHVLNWNKEFNYSEINNYAVKNAKGDIICLLNNDIEVITPGWLSEMVSHAIRPDIGCVGAMLYYPDNTIQHAGVVLGVGGIAGHAHKYFKRGSSGYFSKLKLVHNVSAVTAACLVVQKSVFQEVGGLEEKNLPVAFNDVDLCLKIMAAGYRNLWTPYAELYHHESKTRGKDNTPEKRKRAAGEVQYMKKRWGHLINNDPYYSPNLTLRHEDFSIRLPD